MSSYISLLKAGLNSHRSGILIIDSRDGTIVEYNQKFLKLWQLSDQRIKGQYESGILDQLYAQIHGPDIFCQLGDKLTRDTSGESADSILLKSGDVLEVILTPLLTDDGIPGRMWSFRNITREVCQQTLALARAEAAHLAAIAILKKRGEDVVKSVELRFHSVFEGSKDAIVLATSTGTLDCNGRAVELFEASSKAELMSNNLFSMSPALQPNKIESAAAAQYHLMQGYQEGSHEYEWVYRTCKGRDFSAEVVLHSFAHDGQRVLQFTIRDISDHKRAEQAINAQREKLVAAAKMASLGEMAGGVAHEINNPLAIIIGQTSLLKRYLERGFLEAEPFTAGLLKIENTAQRIAKIVNGLRLFSRNSDNEPMERVGFSDIVDQTLDLCREKFRHHNIEFIVDVETDIILECRAAQIAQVIMNLLSNAYDAVKDREKKWIRLDGYADESSVNIVVADSGTGISSSIRDKIMQPFFTTKEVGTGTGLGLSISRGISEDHGGSLFYDAEAPNSTFVFTLPLSQQGRTDGQAVFGLSRAEQFGN